MSNSRTSRKPPPPKHTSKMKVWIPILALLIGAAGLFGILVSLGGHGASTAKAAAGPATVVSTVATSPNGKSLSQAVQDHGQAVLQGVNDGTQQQAAGVTLTTSTNKPGEASVAVGAQTGGCTPGYGAGKQYLAITPPSAAQMNMSVQEMPWTCSEVKTLFPQGIVVNQPGVDPAHLDGNKDGIACDNGDAG